MHECREGDEAAASIEGAPHEEDAKRVRLEAWKDGLKELYHRQHLVGRVGLGEDVAEAVEYVMGAGFLSGQVSGWFWSEQTVANRMAGNHPGRRREQEEEPRCLI